MSTSPDHPPSRAGGFRALRSWIRGMVESMKPHDPPLAEAPSPGPPPPDSPSSGPPPPDEEILPSWDVPTPPSGSPAAGTSPPMAVPVAEPSSAPPVLEGAPAFEAAPRAEPVEPGEAVAYSSPPPGTSASPPFPGEIAPALAALAEPMVPPRAGADAAPAPTTLCPACTTPRPPLGSYCDSCGYWFPGDGPAAITPPPPASPADHRVRGRYELGQPLADHGGLERFRALDHGAVAGGPVPGGPVPGGPVPVVLFRQRSQAPLDLLAPGAPAASATEASTQPNHASGSAQARTAPHRIAGPGLEESAVEFDLTTTASSPATDDMQPRPRWPGVCWERYILDTAGHPFLPAVREVFTEDGYDYLVEEIPAGRSLWDCWDDPEGTMAQRFTWLRQVAEQLQALHHAGAMPETLRPDAVVIDRDGQARLSHLVDLLPVPVPGDAPVRGTLYTAPELLSHPEQATPRANLYSLGATLYSLLLGRELTDMDFDQPGRPKPFLARFPDAHPALGRLLMKTFTRDPGARFPTDEASREDPTGFTELLHALDACARTLDHVRLEIAAWTTTGMVRSGNEDGFALLHATESRQDDLGDQALVLLADGMGGYEAGEVAAALALQVLRHTLVQQVPFAALAGASAFAEELPGHEGNSLVAADVEDLKKRIAAALREANRQVFSAARGGGAGRRGMGCTAEVVYVNGRHVVVGHVGDSRTYHLHDGRLVRLTRDHTLVNRLVELGTLTPEEAECHPRRNELQQAIGGQPDVAPGLSHGTLRPGDWVIVCSDGLSNHVKDRDLAQMLQGEALSAEMAARRLVNLVNIQGALDNATVVVVRAT